MQDIPAEVSNLGVLAHSALSEAHRFRMAFAHLISGLRAHINHFDGCLGEVDRDDLKPMRSLMEGLREDTNRLVGRMEILAGLGPSYDPLDSIPETERGEGTAAETNCNGLLDFPKAGRLA